MVSTYEGEERVRARKLPLEEGESPPPPKVHKKVKKVVRTLEPTLEDFIESLEQELREQAAFEAAHPRCPECRTEVTFEESYQAHWCINCKDFVRL